MSLILDGGVIAGEMAALFPKTEPMRDRLYLCPTVEWAQRFGEWTAPQVQERRRLAAAARARMGGQEKHDEGDDCDDTAFWVMEQAHTALRKNMSHLREGYGYAVGYSRLFINLDENLNGIIGNGFDQHACNIIRTPDGLFLFDGATGRHELALAAVRRGACVLHFGWM